MGVDTTALTTGWEPDVPPGDSITRQALLAHVARAEQVAVAAGRPWMHDDDVAAADQGLPGLFGSWAFLLHPDRVDSALDRLHRFYGAGEHLLVSPFPTKDLRDRGYGRVGHPPLMYLPAVDRTPAAPPDLHLDEATGPAAHEAFVETLVEAFPLPEWRGLPAGSVFPAALLDGRVVRFWTGRSGGAVVCTAAATVQAGINLVELVSTHPEARGRGFGAAVTWAASTADPQLPAALLASDDGRSVYERMGYRTVSRWTLWRRPARL